MFAIKYREMLLQVPGLYEELDAFYKRLNAFLRTAHADDGSLLTEAGLGEVVDLPYQASTHFSAQAPMVWTVAAGHVVTCAYSLVGHTATVYVNIAGAVLSGSPAAEIYVSNLPFAAARTVHNLCRVSGPIEVGYMRVTPGVNWITIRRHSEANYNLLATYVEGQITFPIT